MKIESVRIHVLEAPLSEIFSWSFDQTDKRTACLIEICTDTGLQGWGECFGPAELNAAIARFLATRIIGDDPLATDMIWQKLYNGTRDQGQKGIMITALSGIDNALWDVKGKHFSCPAHVLMGGPLRSKVPAYATGTYRRGTGPAQDYIRPEVQGYRDAGFKGVKLKIGFDVNADARLIEEVRDTIGNDMALMIDANHGYSVKEAVELGRRVGGLDIGWFEEPVVPEDLHHYAELRHLQPVPIAGGETEFTRWGFRNVLAHQAMDIIQPDTCAAGGLSECKKIADMATANGVRYIPHVWGTGIGMGAALQLLAVLPDTPPSHDPLEPWLEYDQSEHPFRSAIIQQEFKLKDGYVDIPTGPGLGIKVNERAISEFRANLIEVGKS